MRKMYQEPAVEVAKLHATTSLLTGSPVGPAPAPGVNAGRSGYGDGISDSWD